MTAVDAADRVDQARQVVHIAPEKSRPDRRGAGPSAREK